MLLFAVISMILALSLYSIGVWGERLRGTLRWRDLVFFICGLVFDTSGTAVMGKIAGSWSFNLHSLTGLLALVCMAVHALWACIVLMRKKPAELSGFHKLSLFVWILWLIPFVLGMIMAMGN
ncbi:MAG: TIGR03987 family protein [Spirochaetaceae bacterium]|nr:TIGR03987 family protein [Spirochaetaceae bacterium]